MPSPSKASASKRTRTSSDESEGAGKKRTTTTRSGRRSTSQYQVLDDVQLCGGPDSDDDYNAGISPPRRATYAKKKTTRQTSQPPAAAAASSSSPWPSVNKDCLKGISCVVETGIEDKTSALLKLYLSQAGAICQEKRDIHTNFAVSSKPSLAIKGLRVLTSKEELIDVVNMTRAHKLSGRGEELIEKSHRASSSSTPASPTRLPAAAASRIPPSILEGGAFSGRYRPPSLHPPQAALTRLDSNSASLQQGYGQQQPYASPTTGFDSASLQRSFGLQQQHPYVGPPPGFNATSLQPTVEQHHASHAPGFNAISLQPTVGQQPAIHASGSNAATSLQETVGKQPVSHASGSNLAHDVQETFSDTGVDFQAAASTLLISQDHLGSENRRSPAPTNPTNPVEGNNPSDAAIEIKGDQEVKDPDAKAPDAQPLQDPPWRFWGLLRFRGEVGLAFGIRTPFVGYFQNPFYRRT